MREIPCFHRRMFERWRYSHEMLRDTVQPRALNAALHTIVGEFGAVVDQAYGYSIIEAG